MIKNNPTITSTDAFKLFETRFGQNSGYTRASIMGKFNSTKKFSQLNVKKSTIITTTPDPSPIIQPVEDVQLQNVTPDKHGSAEGNNSTTTTTTTTTTTNRNPQSPSMSVQTSPSLVGIPSFLDSVEEDNMNFHSPLDDLIEANRAELTSA
ncbi:hypothetical protein PPL_11215 [Heterostelium album PN500]|uniref:Uncharacterized protein n=1 Tax=Heterostelium pallidum (strain ATCC 26659 / Pp 5 / PN500) TaxID=670386 RepID=D3BTV5_HETP5|nr:hypothetical protein PPL_11215 [Heterostelium album PN500]EFA75141.1 hypothetical protein PPL_11215 [Heterostelium album PN500]|eukprot:XP_020427275.1 hypothetical protein PPL_11215 [Heterostelium album PN500]